ncbi:MAG: leucine-rich repeat protein, partial [Muribaculaceae bacterium]|nr:leucine-rich repeat protein [Muribaculaceae bacterium]
MKTLNQTLRSILLAFALIGTIISVKAYDMFVNGLYFNITGNEAAVTYIDYNSNYGHNYYSQYSGHVTIPDKVTYNGLNYTVTVIGPYAFENCKNMTSVALPNTITTISNSAFHNCDKLVNITIPTSVTFIDGSAFYDCDGLTSIVIPDSLTTIESYAFYSCDKLSNLFLGKSLTLIGTDAFRGSPLTYITCLAETPPTLYTSSFNSYANTTLYVPVTSIEAYRTASVWKNFKIITDFKPNYLSLDDVTTMHSDTIVVPVMMENENEITAFQTDIYMVEGFELLKVGDEYQVELSERKGRDHVIMASETPDGAVRVASYSPSLKAFKGTEGALFYLTIKVPDNGNGVYPFTLKNTRLTTLDEDEVLSPDASCNINVLPFILGDVDGSGEITIADVVQTARYILYLNPEPFIFGAADLNGDGKITITDVVKIANLVLDADYGNSSLMMPKHAVATSECMNGAIIKNGSMSTVNVSLENSIDYTAFQFDVILPQGMSASDFALAERADDLGLRVRDHGNGRVRVLAYSPALKTIKGDNGNILSFDVMGENDILIDNIALVTPEGETIHVNGLALNAGNVTGTEELTTAKSVENVNYFNLAGQQLNQPNSGVNIVVT